MGNLCQKCKGVFVCFAIAFISVVSVAVWHVSNQASFRKHEQDGQQPPIFGQAEIPQVDAAIHLGGFCFGHSHDPAARVGEVTLKLHADEFHPADNNMQQEAWVVMYDDRDDHWGEVRDAWSQSTCEQRLSRATAMQSFTWNTKETSMIVSVKQWTMSRHWHAVIISCGSPHKITFSYWLSAEKDLARWGAGELNPEACPDDWTVQQHLEEVEDDVIKFLAA